MGNTAEEVLRQVDCSVLTEKPEGFRAPTQCPPDSRVPRLTTRSASGAIPWSAASGRGTPPG